MIYKDYNKQYKQWICNIYFIYLNRQNKMNQLGRINE
jgi:hypothetical protein